MNANIALQDRFLERFFSGPLAEQFYLTGGTALARFYFHHRESLDLDLFTNDQSQNFGQVNQMVLSILYSLNLQIISQATTDTYIQYILTDSVGTTLKVELVKDIPVRFGDPIFTAGVRVDSLENIGSNKMLAIFGRTDAKYFIDLYWILQETDLMFDELYRQAQQKDTGLSALYLSFALQNIEKVHLFPRMLKPLDWEEITEFFNNLSRDLLSGIKPE